MQRFFATTVALAIFVIASPASAQQWADKMFSTLDHDFGTVAKGSDTVFRFEVKNLYKEDIHIASVRTSCNCTTPSIENNTIKTFEKAYIVAKFNTRTHSGRRNATLTVSIDKPYRAQVQLRVHGHIRSDVVFEPGSVNFGTVDQGTQSQKSVAVNYAGYSGWRITDVRSASSDLEVELIQRNTVNRRAAYNLVVRLKPTARPGFLKEQLVLVTSDNNNPRIPLVVEGRIMPEISVAPMNLVLGEVPAGETVTKRLIVRGKKPFRVTKVRSDASGFKFQTDKEASDRHIIDIAFTPQTGEGVIKTPIVVETDLGASYTASCTAYATLRPAPASSEPAAPDAGEATSTAADPQPKDSQGRLAQDQ